MYGIIRHLDIKNNSFLIKDNKYMLKNPIQFNIILFIILLCNTCISKKLDYAHNIEPFYISFVPARTTVLPCLKWPKYAYFKNLPMTNFTEKHIQIICNKFDNFIIQGFTNQPYMKGYSPKAVNKILNSTKNSNIQLSDINHLWKSDPLNKGILVSSPIEYYKKIIMPKQEWQKWVYELGIIMNYSDTILIPLILYGYDIQYKERGFDIYKKTAKIIMLLIDTSNAKLIWYGMNEAFTQTQKEINRTSLQPLEPPSLDILIDKLFSNILWKEYPGRLVSNN